MWKQHQKTKQSSLSLMWKWSSFSCGVENEATSSLSISFSFMCRSNFFPQIILSFVYIVESYIWLLPWCCSLAHFLLTPPPFSSFLPFSLILLLSFYFLPSLVWLHVATPGCKRVATIMVEEEEEFQFLFLFSQEPKIISKGREKLRLTTTCSQQNKKIFGKWQWISSSSCHYWFAKALWIAIHCNSYCSC
jgi:hypothetical protein